MWWQFVLVFTAGMFSGFLLTSVLASNPRDEQRESEEFYQAMRDLKEKREGRDGEHFKK